jgi:hypothetical protein
LSKYVPVYGICYTIACIISYIATSIMQDYIKRILIHSLAILIENGVNGSDNLGQPGVGGCMRAVDN